jgi:cyclic pyranopterin phosphate synthase
MQKKKYSDGGKQMGDPLRIDGTKVHFHPARVVQLMQDRDNWETAKNIFPIYVEVSPSGACNHRCTFCGVDYVGYKSILLDADMYAIRIAEMAELGVKSVMFAGEGEPLLHKHIDHMVLSTVASGVDVAFTTNGVLLDKLETLPQCNWVKVSLNAGTRETYAKVHRTQERDWYKVWLAIKNAVKRKGKCMLGVQMVLLPENEKEAPLLQLMCEDAGVDYLVFKPYSQHKSSFTRQYEKFKPALVQPTFKKTVVRTESINTTEIPYEKCHATPFLWSYVMASGDVYSCSAYLLDERFRLGNLNQQSFKEIWHGEKRRANYEFVRNELDIHDCRLNCRQDKANRYLDELTRGVPGVNFI